MREFRAKTTKKENGEHAFNNVWVEGDLVVLGNKHYIHPRANAFQVDNELAKLVIMHEVIPETVGQFTGLPDKNGKKVFDGDIVRQQTFHKLPLKYDNEKEKKDHKKYLIKKCGAIFDSEETYHKDYIWEVKFENARFYPFADDNFEWGNFDWDIPFEVIGNIHDNKELLDKGE